MVIEKMLPPFWQWLLDGAGWWGLTILILLVLGVAIAWLLLVFRAGPAAAFLSVVRGLANIAGDFAQLSWRRTWAMTHLAYKEAVRRRVVAAFFVFILLVFFAGWFIDPRNPEPAKLYITFTFTSTSYLIILLSLFLATFSLPQDIRTRTIHTVVTKPVRRGEIVAGRILGFALVGTVLLLVLAVVSYLFVVAGVRHTHTITADDLSPLTVAGAEEGTLMGYTSLARGHRHKVYVEPSGKVYLEQNAGHWHSIRMVGSGENARFEIGPPEGQLLARVPVYGKLKFRDREGMDAEKGINVGDEWTYRGYIEGATDCAAIWTFDGVTPELFPEGLLVEMNIGVFRTHKGEIERGVLGSIAVRNPRTGLIVETEIFESAEFAIKRLFIPRKITRFSSAQVIARKQATEKGIVFSPPQSELDFRLAQKSEFDLFKDLVDNGRVEIWLRCIEAGQYFGVAQPDLYLRARDGYFTLNFVKGYLGIWMQMLLVIAYGVMFSTFLSTPIAMLATAGVLIGGFASEFMWKLALGPEYGGGPLESLYRMATQENMVIDLPPGLGTAIIKAVDFVLEKLLFAIAAVLPPFNDFGCANYVAHGFDVPGNFISIRMVHTLGVVLPLFVVGTIFLRSREIAE